MISYEDLVKLREERATKDAAKATKSKRGGKRKRPATEADTEESGAEVEADTQPKANGKRGHKFKSPAAQEGPKTTGAGGRKRKSAPEADASMHGQSSTTSSFVITQYTFTQPVVQ